MTRHPDDTLIYCERCKGPLEESEFTIESFEVSGGKVLCESCTDEMYENALEEAIAEGRE